MLTLKNHNEKDIIEVKKCQKFTPNQSLRFYMGYCFSFYLGAEAGNIKIRN